MSQAVFCSVAAAALSQDFYGAWSPPFPSGPLQDAWDFQHDIAGVLLRPPHSQPVRQVWLGSDKNTATRDAVTARLEGLARELQEGDLLVWYFAGHGARVPNAVGDGEPFTQVLCMTDGFLHGRELDVAWTKFREGVRIVVVADACHSGTVANHMLATLVSDRVRGDAAAVPGADTVDAPEETPGERPQHEWQVRAIPDRVAAAAYEAHQSDVDEWAETAARERRRTATPMPQGVISFSACRNDEVAYTTRTGQGLFTKALLTAWSREQAARDSYSGLLTKTNELTQHAGTPTSQTPQLNRYGTVDDRALTAMPTFSLR